MRNVNYLLLSILLSTFLIVGTVFGSDSSYDKRAIIITPNLINGGDNALKANDSIELTGTICAIKIEDGEDGDDDNDHKNKHDREKEHKNPKCKKLKNNKIEITAYFDNDLKDITNALVITKSKGAFRYSYTTPPLIEGQTNRFTLIVGKVKSETKRLLKTKAKIYKRIEYINIKIAKYQGNPEKIKNLVFLTDFKATLEQVVINIDKVIERQPNVLSRISIPLQVGNDHSAKMFYSTIWGENKLIIEAGTGRPIQGETSSVKATVFNIGDHHDWFPEFEPDKDSDEKERKYKESRKDKKIEFEGYELALSFKGQNVFTSNLFELKRAGEFTHTFTTPRLQPTDFNLIGLSLIEVEKEIEIEDGVEKIEIEKETKGKLSLIIPVSTDTVAPVWSDLLPLSSVQYVQNIPEVSAIVSDSFGRVDIDTFKFNLSGQLIDGTIYNQDKTASFLKVDQDQKRKYKVSANLQTLPEGLYSWSFTAKDYASNIATPNPATGSLRVDRTKPLIALNQEDNQLLNNPNFVLPVIITDHSSVNTMIYHNGQVIYETTETIFDLPVTLFEGINTFKIYSVDHASNIATPVSLGNIELDTIAPVLTGITPTENDIVSILDFPLQGSSNERLSRLLVNGNNFPMALDGKSFNSTFKAYTEGFLNLEITAVDMAGNTTIINNRIEIVLKLINESLIAVHDDPSGKLKIVGIRGASRPGATIDISGGFFNSTTVISNSLTGEFEVLIDRFKRATLTVTDDEIGRTESANLTYNIDTTLSGIVVDHLGNPLSGATIKIVNSDQSTITDGTGAFSIPEPLTGDQLIEIDGSTIPVQVSGPNKSFPKVNVAVRIGTYQTNVIERPVYLTPLMLDGTETEIDGSTEAIVTTPHAQGVELVVPASSATFPDGTDVGKINIVEISKDATTVPVPSFAVPNTIYAFEPSGLTFKEKVALTLPNKNGFLAGAQFVILSKNSKTGSWEVDGAAEVSVDGQSIVTKPNSGISHFSEIFAIPVGLKISDFKPTNIGADAFSGSSSSQITLPSFKTLGQDISPSLIYQSKWAHPNAVISNIIDIKRNEVSWVASQTVDKGFWSSTITTVDKKRWIEPEKVTSTFQIDDFISPPQIFTGLPNKSVISYSMDMSQSPSGLYSTNAHYDIKLKEMTITTTLRRKHGWFWNQTLDHDSKSSQKIFDEVFPQDISGELIIQNKKNSVAGTGWKIGGIQKLISPNKSKILLEEGDGSTTIYAIDNTISTIISGVEAASFSNDYVTYIGLDNKLNRYDLIGGNSTNNIGTIDSYSGYISYNYSIQHGWSGPWYNRQRAFFCHDIYAYYSQTRHPSDIIETKSGEYLVTDPQGEILKVSNGVSSVVSGLSIGAPSAHNSPYACNYSGVSCYQHIAARTYPSPWCSAPLGSGGRITRAGFGDGHLSGAVYNKPSSMAISPISNTIAVADTGNNRVRLVDFTTHQTTTIVGNGAKSDTGDGGFAVDATIYRPRGVVYDSAGNLYISTESGFIRKVDVNGRISRFAGSSTGNIGLSSTTDQVKLLNPYGMAIDELKGFLYVADTNANRIVRINVNTNKTDTVAGNRSCIPSGDIGDGGSSLNASLCYPEKVAVDFEGNLLVMDKGHNKIRKITFNNSSYGTVAYVSNKQDNSKLLKNVDGSYTRTYRNGLKVNFDSLGKQLNSIDRIGNTTTFDYEFDTNNILSITNSVGAVLLFQYDGTNLVSITDPAGRVTSFNHSGNELTEVVFPDNSKKLFSYDFNGLLLGETDLNGNLTEFTYNNWNRITSIKKPNGAIIKVNDSTSKTFSSGTTTAMKSLGTGNGELYDGITNAKNIETKMAKNENGFVNTIINGEGKITTIERDIKGRPTIITRPDTSAVTFTYNQTTGDLIKKEESLTGGIYNYTFDQLGNEIFKSSPQGSETKTYNNQGLLIRKENHAGQFTTYTYNNMGLVLTKTNALGQTQVFEYDLLGNVSKIISNDGKFSTFTRDFAGNVTQVKNAKGQIKKREYDSFNRLIAVVEDSSIRSDYFYDNHGNLLEIKDPYGNKTQFVYNFNNELVQKIDPLGYSTFLTYDLNGNVIKEIDPNGNVKNYEYNNSDKLTRKVLPDNEYLLSYDLRGNLSEIKDNFSTLSYTYQHTEEGDLLTSETSLNSFYNHSISYNYNNFSELIGMVTDYTSETYQRDNLGRLTNLVNGKGESFSFSYNIANMLTSISRPGSITNYTFNLDNNLLEKIEHTKGLSDIEYAMYSHDSIGNKKTRQTSRGIASFSYDNRNQIKQVIGNNVNIENENFNYDLIGNRDTDKFGSFNYGAKRQLLMEDYHYSYTYDKNGNLTSKQEKGLTGIVENFIYDSQNRLIGYDKFNGLTKLKDVTYIYDAANRRIAKVVNDILNPINSLTRAFIYNGNEIIHELDESQKLLATYTHSGLRTDDVLSVDVTAEGVLQKVAKSVGSLFYLKDALGSVTNIVNEFGNKVQSYAYSAFGKILSIEDGFGNDISASPVLATMFSFTGRFFDSESGNYYYRARYYNAGSGRFLQKDSSPGSLFSPLTSMNSYIYGSNNPVINVDPTGKSFINTIVTFLGHSVSIILPAIIGGLSAGEQANRSGGSALQVAGVTIMTFFAASAAAAASSAVFASVTLATLPFLGPAALLAGYVAAGVTAGLFSAFSNAINQKIMGRNINWKRALKAGTQGAIITTCLFGIGTIAGGGFGAALIGGFGGAAAVFATDSGVVPMTENEIESESYFYPTSFNVILPW